MKKLLAGIAAIMAVTGAASAADLGGSIKDDPGYASVPGATVNWTGIYLGGTIGYGNANHNLKADGTATERVGPQCSSGFLNAEGDGCLETVVVGKPEDKNACTEAGGTDFYGSKCFKKEVVREASDASCDIGTPLEAVCVDPENDDEPIEGAVFTPAQDEITQKTEVVLTEDREVDGAFIPGFDIEHTASAFIDGLNSPGVFGGGTIGFDVQKDSLLFGVFGDYNFGAGKTRVGFAIDDVGFSDTIIEEKNSWLIAARAGYLFGQEKRALLYVLGGYGQTEFSYADLGDKTFSGFVAGAGGEYAVMNNVFLGIEYQHFFGGKETLFDDAALGFDNIKLTDDVDTDKVMAKLKIKFGGVDRLY